MTFNRETSVKAVRKPVQCDACLVMIETGSPATRWAGMSDGQFASVAYHPDCREAEIAMNKLHDTMFFDEWQGLGEIEHEDHDWLIAEYPAVAARMGIVAKEPTP